MQNTLKTRVTGVSHVTISIGVFLTVVFLFAILAQEFASLFGMDISNLREIDIESLSTRQSVVLRITQSFTGIALIASAYLCTLLFRVPFLRFTGFTNKVKWYNILIPILILLALMPVLTQIIQWNDTLNLPESLESKFRELEETSNSLYAQMLAYNTGAHFWLNILAMCLIPAIGEELFFRGIFMRVVANWTRNVHIGILLSALFFALVHLQPYKFLPMILMGLLLGYVYYRTQSIWAPILLHAFNNSLVVISDYTTKLGNTPDIMAEDYTFSFLSLAVSAGLSGFLIFRFWKNTKHSDFTYD